MQNINICDAQRTPPLHLAGRCGNAPAVKKFFYLEADVSVVKADKNDAIRLKRLKNEPERIEEYIEFGFPRGADVSVVKAVKYDAIRLEWLKNEPEWMEEYLNFKKGSTQKPLQNISNQRKY